MEMVELTLLAISILLVFETNGQEGDKLFNPVLVEQDLGVETTWEIDLTAKGYSLLSELGYYKLYNQNLTWGIAWQQCDTDGAHLLILNSEAEVEAVKNIVTANDTLPYGYFIGFHDYFVEGTYLTIHGEHLESTGYLKWGAGQPDNYKGGEDCGAMRKDGYLADVPCYNSYYFICERELR